jgi:uncharacterized membrane protein YcaP (DUF421 family)
MTLSGKCSAMKLIIEVFGQGKDLTILQMSCRGIVVFMITLLLIRISGRRSFGMRTPLDNIIVITLGALLSRAIVGASSFFPVIVCSLVIVCMHRAFGWAMAHNKRFAELVEGKKMLLFEDGQFVKKNLDDALVCKEDVMRDVRKRALTENLERIDKIYFENTGEISPVKK